MQVYWAVEITHFTPRLYLGVSGHFYIQSSILQTGGKMVASDGFGVIVKRKVSRSSTYIYCFAFWKSEVRKFCWRYINLIFFVVIFSW